MIMRLVTLYGELLNFLEIRHNAGPLVSSAAEHANVEVTNNLQVFIRCKNQSVTQKYEFFGFSTVAKMPACTAFLKSLQVYSKRSLAMRTRCLSFPDRLGSPRGSSLLRSGLGSDQCTLISLALEAVPQTGAKCIHNRRGESIQCSSNKRSSEFLRSSWNTELRAPFFLSFFINCNRSS